MKNFLAQFGLRFTTGHAIWAAALIPACIVIAFIATTEASSRVWYRSAAVRRLSPYLRAPFASVVISVAMSDCAFRHASAVRRAISDGSMPPHLGTSALLEVHGASAVAVPEGGDRNFLGASLGLQARG